VQTRPIILNVVVGDCRPTCVMLAMPYQPAQLQIWFANKSTRARVGRWRRQRCPSVKLQRDTAHWANIPSASSLSRSLCARSVILLISLSSLMSANLCAALAVWCLPRCVLQTADRRQIINRGLFGLTIVPTGRYIFRWFWPCKSRVGYRKAEAVDSAFDSNEITVKKVF